ncbi:MAG: alpha/beta hydrolase fold, partial [Mycobacterium sp.]|nr:alpha/beta hydrolase fold [Mycobacterium sp.]
MPDNEFSMLHENAEELGRPLPKDLAVQRGCLELGPGEHLSYLRWGTAQPDVVLLHGGGQNAHTWDSVLVVLNRPAIAFDLPGHGHSYRRHDRDYGPWNNAEAIAAAISGLVERPVVLVGMSLGGATAIRVTAEHPALFRSTLLVDVTPGVNDPERTIPRNDRGTVALIGGPPSFDTLEEMVNAAIALSPRRPASAVRRGVIHNSHQSRD